MVQKGSIIKVADNSGAKRLNVVGIPGYSHKRYAFVGDIITCSVRGAIPNSAVSDHQVVKAVLVRCSKERRRKDGTYIRFDENAAVIIDIKDNKPKGTRIFGPVSSELRDKGFMRIVNLAPEVW